MANRLITWAMNQQVGDVGAKFVLIALADGAWANGEYFASHKTLVDDTEIPRRTLQRKLDYLVENGFIAIEPRYRPGSGGRSSNLYRLLASVEHLRKCSEEIAVPPGQNGAAPLATALRSPLAKGGAAYDPSSLPLQSSEELFSARDTPDAEAVEWPNGLAGRWAAVPAVLRRRILCEARKDEGWAASYLDPCAIELDGGTIHPATGVAGGELGDWHVRQVLASAGLTIGEKVPLAQLQRALAASKAPDR